MRSVRGETIRNGVFTVAAGLMLAGLFGPWVWSGTSARSSFELLDLVARLGFTPDGVFSWLIRPWPIVPLMLVGSVLAVWSERSRAGAVLGAASGIYVVAVTASVIMAPDSGLVDMGWGVPVSMVGGLVVLGVSCWIGVAARSA